MIVSAFLITWNEEEQLPYCLKFLDWVPGIEEICIVDSQSTDKTPEIIKEFQKTSRKKVKWQSHPFSDFGQQKNLALEMTCGDWVLGIDADEVYSPQLAKLICDLDQPALQPFNAIIFRRFDLIFDRHHCVHSDAVSYQTRMWRRGFARYRGEIHEMPITAEGRILYCHQGADVLWCPHTPAYANVIIKHGQLLKSDENLKIKGERWEHYQMHEKSQAMGLQLGTQFWLNAKHSVRKILMLPKELDDSWADDTQHEINI